MVGTMERIFLQRIASIILFVAFVAIAVARTMLDLIGWSTAPDDAGTAMRRLDHFFSWLLTIPWWLPWGAAMAITAILIWTVWPRTIIMRNVGSGIAEFSKGQELTPTGIGLMLDGLERDECAIMLTLHVRNRSAYDLKLLSDEVAIHMDGQKLDIRDNRIPVQITADSTANVPIYTGRFKRYVKEARGTVRATIRFGRDARCNSSVTFAYSFDLLSPPPNGWNVIEPVPQTLTLLEYALKT